MSSFRIQSILNQRRLYVAMAHRRWLWYGVTVYLGFIYGSLPFTRYLVELLYSSAGRTLAGVIVNTALGVVVVAVGVFIVRSEKTAWVKALAFVLLTAGGILSVTAGLPEERIHFVEYGVLGYLLFLAVSQWARPVVTSLLMVLMAGTIDEAIQWALPSRVGDLKDILLNTLGGAIGINVGWIHNKDT